MKLTRITGDSCRSVPSGCRYAGTGQSAGCFTDHMVLQQKSEVPMWGWGSASATIKVVGSWAPQDTATTVVRSDGTWDTTLKTIGAGGPYTLSVLGDGTRELKDVMLGEVWLCSGQSIWNGLRCTVSTTAKKRSPPPIIRISVSSIFPNAGLQPRRIIAKHRGHPCTPDRMKSTSAIAYFFGRDLQKRH